MSPVAVPDSTHTCSSIKEQRHVITTGTSEDTDDPDGKITKMHLYLQPKFAHVAKISCQARCLLSW